MKSFTKIRSTFIALVITFGAASLLSGCFVDDDEVFEQVDNGGNNDGTGQETNDDQWK